MGLKNKCMCVCVCVCVSSAVSYNYGLSGFDHIHFSQALQNVTESRFTRRRNWGFIPSSSIMCTGLLFLTALFACQFTNDYKKTRQKTIKRLNMTSFGSQATDQKPKMILIAVKAGNWGILFLYPPSREINAPGSTHIHRPLPLHWMGVCMNNNFDTNGIIRMDIHNRNSNHITIYDDAP